MAKSLLMMSFNRYLIFLVSIVQLVFNDNAVMQSKDLIEEGDC